LQHYLTLQKDFARKAIISVLSFPYKTTVAKAQDKGGEAEKEA
jgi:hypothetical protein